MSLVSIDLFMSVSLCTIGHHHLKTDDAAIVARQLSDIFDINIKWGYWGKDDFVEQGRITKHEACIYHELQDESGEEFPVLYQLDVPRDVAEENRVQFWYMSIYKDIIDISISGWPYRAADYERCFLDREPPMEGQTVTLLRNFRMQCKTVFGKLGISKVFCFGNGYSVTGFIEETRLGMDWEDFEDYILSGRYLDDTEGGDEYHWKVNSMVVCVSDFLSGKKTTRCHGGADIFVDDFADL